MAIEFFDGGDHLGIATTQHALKWDAGSSTLLGKTTGVYGQGEAYTAVTGGANRILQKTVTAGATKIQAFHIYVPSLPGSDQAFFNVRDGTTLHVDLRITSTGAIRATRNGTSLGITAGTPFSAGQWFWVAVKYTIDDASGSVEVHVNNTQVLNLTSVDTRNGAAAQMTNFQLVIVLNSMAFDNIFSLDTSGSAPFNDLPTEEWIIRTSSPNGAGNYTQYTPSAGSNYQNVDDGTTHDSDSTYNASSTVGQKDTFTFPALNGVVRAMQTNFIARKDDAGTREFREVCRAGGTDYTGATKVLGASYAWYNEVRLVDPNTGLAFATMPEIGYETVN